MIKRTGGLGLGLLQDTQKSGIRIGLQRTPAIALVDIGMIPVNGLKSQKLERIRQRYQGDRVSIIPIRAYC